MKNVYVVGGNGFAKECYQHIMFMHYKNPEINFVGFLAGYPNLRKIIYEDIKAKQNSKFLTIILEPYSYLSPLVEVGEGNIFMSPCTPSPHVKIGNGNLFNGDITIAHDVEIGDFNFFGGKTQVLGGAKIGNSNTIGTASVILPKAKIGNNNKIAPISCIYKGCKNNCYMQGNPALKVGDIDE